jgi:hypothetical protein
MQAVAHNLERLSYLRYTTAELPNCIGWLLGLTRLDLVLDAYSEPPLPGSFCQLQQLQDFRVRARRVLEMSYPNVEAMSLRGLERLAGLPALRRLDCFGLCFGDLGWVQASGWVRGCVGAWVRGGCLKARHGRGCRQPASRRVWQAPNCTCSPGSCWRPSAAAQLQRRCPGYSG